MAETTIQPLKADPKRQANDSLRGYRYQILHSVNAWLDLAKMKYSIWKVRKTLTRYQVTRLQQCKLKTQNAQSRSDLRK